MRARGALCKTIGSAMQARAREDVDALRRRSLALVEAAERQLELTLPQITSRLFSAYDKSMRDEDELKDAIIFNSPSVHLH